MASRSRTKSTRTAFEGLHSHDIHAAASGARKRLAWNQSLEEKLPLVPVRYAAKRRVGQSEVPPFDAKGLAARQSVRDLPAG